ncbi:MAG: hypothetical protein J6C90_00375 [Clostridia bacterium]|nr:hypothetical protein [Clostridia bacterium]
MIIQDIKKTINSIKKDVERAVVGIKNDVISFFRTEEFINKCLNDLVHDEAYNRDHPVTSELDEQFQICLALAKLDIRVKRKEGFAHDPNVSADAILQDTRDFYQWLDRDVPDNRKLSPRIERLITTDCNVHLWDEWKVVREDGSVKNEDRARCLSRKRIGENQYENGHIFISTKPDIRNRKSVPHEFAHALGRGYWYDERHKSEELVEMVTVPIDLMSNQFFSEKYPDRKADYMRTQAIWYEQVCNEAKDSLADACFMKIAGGQMSVAEFNAKYRVIIGESRLANRCQNYKNNDFEPMHEYRYTIPNLVSFKVMQDFAQDRAGTIARLQDILEKETRLTTQQAFNILGINMTKQELVQNFASNYKKSLRQLNKEATIQK